MFGGSERKEIRRKDAIYNPIEGKWEKRNSTTQNENVLARLGNQLELESIKTAINDIKKNGNEQASTPPADLSGIKKAIYMPIEKLKDIKRQQDLHDKKLFAGNEEEYKAAEKNETLMIIKIVIAAVLLIIAAMN